jgi:hypothetical protein
VLAAHRHLRLDNSQLDPQETVERIVALHAAK